jgi:hypothetical protein
MIASSISAVRAREPRVVQLNVAGTVLARRMAVSGRAWHVRSKPLRVPGQDWHVRGTHVDVRSANERQQ